MKKSVPPRTTHFLLFLLLIIIEVLIARFHKCFLHPPVSGRCDSSVGSVQLCTDLSCETM